MSVIVRRFKSNTMEVYVKGAPEVMADICEKETCMVLNCKLFVEADRITAVPQDYDDLLSYYTRSGYRVIAVAGKSIEGISWLKAQRMKRCGSLGFLELIDMPSDSSQASKQRAVFASSGWLFLRTSSNQGQRLQFFL